MPQKRNKKGRRKSRSRSTTPIPSIGNNTYDTIKKEEEVVSAFAASAEGSNNLQSATDVTTVATKIPGIDDTCTVVPTLSSQYNPPNDQKNELSLILTSSRRNPFECDICSTDISLVPRIKCAINSEFDICLECFTKVDHSSLSNIKNNGIGGGGGNLAVGKAAEIAKAGAGTEDVLPLSKGYRVADSTRFFVFPALRGVEELQIVEENTDDEMNQVHINTSSDRNNSAKKNTTTSPSPTTTEGKNDDNEEKKNDNDPQIANVEAQQIIEKSTNPATTTDKGQDAKKHEKLHPQNDTDEDKKKNDELLLDQDQHASKRMKVSHDNDMDTSKDTENPINDEDKGMKCIEDENENEMMDVDDDSTQATIKAEKSKYSNNQEKYPNENKETSAIPNQGKEVQKSASGGPTQSTEKSRENETEETTISTSKVNGNASESNENQKNQSKEQQDAGENVPMTGVVKESNVKMDSTLIATVNTDSGMNEFYNITTKKSPENKADDPEPPSQKDGENDDKASNTNQDKKRYTITDDVRYMWTVEEDLRLLEAISTFGLGNWADISEEVSGNSRSTNKTPKKCMERYLDDFLGQYGHILPEFTMVKVEDYKKNYIPSANEDGGDNDQSRKRARSVSSNEDDTMNKEPSVALRTNNTEYCVVKTSSIPGYDKIWPNPYIPKVGNKNIKMGDDVGRDHAVRCEQAYVKEITGALNNEEARNIRKEWELKLNKPGGPTVLPPRPEEVKKLPGAELAGYMPRRGDFDLEWENDADTLLEDMEFLPDDTPEERDIKIKVIEIYNSKLDEREKRKQFLKDHDLLDYRKKQKEDRKLPADERDLVNRMRLFTRFHSAEEHKKLLNELLKAKRLRKEIARLQMYQRMGFTSLLDVERFELDRNRKESHRLACRQKEKEQEDEIAAATKAAGEREATAFAIAEEKETYHRQYKNSDRKNRRSINRNDGSKIDRLNQEDVTDVKASLENMLEKSLVSNGTSLEKEETSTEVGASITANSDKEASKQQPDETPDSNKSTGIELLSSKEIDFCNRMEIQPQLYLKAKKVLIQESLSSGVLEDGTKSERRSVVKIDVRTKGDIVRFVLQSGWIPNNAKQA